MEENQALVGNRYAVDARDRLAARVEQDLDDLLCTMQLVHTNAQLMDRLFEQLVDLFVERLFLSLRAEVASGGLARADYAREVAELAGQCRRAGLLPLPSAGR